MTACNSTEVCSTILPSIVACTTAQKTLFYIEIYGRTHMGNLTFNPVMLSIISTKHRGMTCHNALQSSVQDLQDWHNCGPFNQPRKKGLRSQKLYALRSNPIGAGFGIILGAPASMNMAISAMDPCIAISGQTVQKKVWSLLTTHSKSILENLLPPFRREPSCLTTSEAGSKKPVCVT